MRYPFQGTTKDGNGRIIQSATVTIYLAGVATLASVYTAATGGTAVNSVTADTAGNFTFWVDDVDYHYTQRFDVVISSPNHISKTYSSIEIPGRSPFIDAERYTTFTAAVAAAANKTLRFSSSITLDANIVIPATVSLQPINPGVLVANGKTLTISAPVVGKPRYQWLSGFAAGDVIFNGPDPEVSWAVWWGALPSATATVNLLAIQCALASRTYCVRAMLGYGTYEVNPTVANPLKINCDGGFLEGVARSVHSTNYGTILHNTGTGDCIYISANANFGAGVKNMQITGTSSSRYGINISGTLYPQLENLMIGNYTESANKGHGSHGLRLNGSVYYGAFNNVISRNNYGKGLIIEGTANFNAFQNCQFQDNALGGVHIVSGYSNTFKECDISTNGSGVPGTRFANITSSSVANPTVLTSGMYGLEDGMTVIIHGHSGSTPDINDTEYVISNVTGTSFTIPVNVTVGGTEGLVTGVGGYGIRIGGDKYGYTTSSSVANPTVITTAAAHGLTTGDKVMLYGHSGSTPAINNTVYTATVTGANTFTIPVNVTVGGTGGQWSEVGLDAHGTIFENCNYEVNGYDNEIFQCNTPHGNTRLKGFVGDNIYAHFLSGNVNIVENLFGSGGRVTFESAVDYSMVLLPNAIAMFEYTNNGGGYNKVVGGQNFFTVASAAAFPMPSYGEQVSVSGTTNITSITGGGGAYRTVHLVFQGILTVTHGNNIKLDGAANFVTAANSVLTLLFDTNNWIEVSRKA